MRIDRIQKCSLFSKHSQNIRNGPCTRSICLSPSVMTHSCHGQTRAMDTLMPWTHSRPTLKPVAFQGIRFFSCARAVSLSSRHRRRCCNSSSGTFLSRARIISSAVGPSIIGFGPKSSETSLIPFAYFSKYSFIPAIKVLTICKLIDWKM